jgi:hypothetical protein
LAKDFPAQILQIGDNRPQDYSLFARAQPDDLLVQLIDDALPRFGAGVVAPDLFRQRGNRFGDVRTRLGRGGRRGWLGAARRFLEHAFRRIDLVRIAHATTPRISR